MAYLEFECPQFVDFAAEFDTSGKDDTFFDCRDHQSPENEIVHEIQTDSNDHQSLDDKIVHKNPPDSGDHQSMDGKIVHKNPPAIIVENYPTEEEENRLVSKMEASLLILENTPKVKMGSVKGQLLTEKFSKYSCSQVKPVFKPNTVPRPPIDFLRSKTLARLNKIVTENSNKTKQLRKRSSSLNDLRPHKKQTYAMTPMCLKRTIVKAKHKVLKSTEEMELEEIAKLQKQLREHLRYNELTLKKLKLKPRPCVTSKSNHTRLDSVKENKGLNPFAGNLNVAEKGPRRNIQALNPVDLKEVAMKIDNIIRGQSVENAVAEKKQKENPRKSKNPLVSVAVAIGANEMDKIQANKKPVTNKKFGFHSGLSFRGNAAKNTVVKPFSFDVKIREKFNTDQTGYKDAPLSNSSKCKIDGKENTPCKGFSTIKKTNGMQDLRPDIVKQLALNKKIVDKNLKNPVKGLTFSKNFSRN